MSKIYEKDALILRVNVGTATAEDGTVYELTLSQGSSMLVKSSKTGRTFDIGWQTVVEMAVEAGVNEEPK